METLQILDLMQHTYQAVVEPRFRSLAEDEVSEKKPGDLVTIADKESEREITATLKAAYPDALYVGEEDYSEEIAKAFPTAEHAFTIDPIDGTSNFVNGKDNFALMVSELRGGEITRAWILQPRHNRAYIAEAGAGFWEFTPVANGWAERRINRDSPVAQDPSTWRGVSSIRYVQKANFERLSQVRTSAFSCGIDYPALARGDADFAVYTHEWPWDHSPGALMLAETGGGVLRYDGTRYDPRFRKPESAVAFSDITIAPQVLAEVAPLLAANRKP